MVKIKTFEARYHDRDVYLTQDGHIETVVNQFLETVNFVSMTTVVPHQFHIVVTIAYTEKDD